MFGVVLWSDLDRNRSVIWCEDHGNLAFLKGPVFQGLTACGVEAGDLVQFDIVKDGKIRLATNAQLVEPEAYPQLASRLKRVQDRQQTEEMKAYQGGTSKVIPFGASRKQVRIKNRTTGNGKRLSST